MNRIIIGFGILSLLGILIFSLVNIKQSYEFRNKCNIAGGNTIRAGSGLMCMDDKKEIEIK